MATNLNNDAARRWTDRELGVLEKRMAAEYAHAASDMRAKLEKSLRLFDAEREAREKALDNTREAMEAHKAWLRSQAANQTWMRGMADQLAESAHSANVRAAEAMNGAIPRIYAENANRAAFAVDRAVRADTGFTLVNEEAVRYLMQGGTAGQAIKEVTLTPEAERMRANLQSMRRDIDAAKDIRWNRQKFTSAITQGILQGESIPHIVRRTSDIYGMNRNAAVRAARTATTNAENAGRMASFERAEKLGIDMEIEWQATLDERTRDSHRELDGTRIHTGEVFPNGCRYPGDPAGPPEETWNCRCRADGRVVGFDGVRGDWADERGERWARLPKDTTYEQWKAGKAVSRAESYQNEWGRVPTEWYAGGGTAQSGTVDIAALEQRAADLDARVTELAREGDPYIPSEQTLRDIRTHRDGAEARMAENAWAKDFDVEALRGECADAYDKLAEVDDKLYKMRVGEDGYDALRAEHERLYARIDELDAKIDAAKSYERAKRAFDDYDEQLQRYSAMRAEGLAKKEAAQSALKDAMVERNRAYGELSDAQPFAPHVRSALGDVYADGIERMVDEAAERHPTFAQAYRRFSSQLRVEESNLGRGAYYSSRDKGIHFNAVNARAGDGVHAPHQTTFHEFAHLIDHRAGHGNSFASDMGDLKDTIKADWVRYRNAEGRRLGVTRNKNQAAIQALIDEGARSDCLKYGSLSDIIEGCTGQSYPLGVGHGASYHRRIGATAHEFFAEVFDGAMAYEESYQQLKRVFPNAVRMVENMVEEIIG